MWGWGWGGGVDMIVTRRGGFREVIRKRFRGGHNCD